MNFKSNKPVVEIDTNLWNDFLSIASKKGLNGQTFLQELLKKEIRKDISISF